VTETIVTVLKFEHTERAEILVQTALFFNLSIPFLRNFVSIVLVTTGSLFVINLLVSARQMSNISAACSANTAVASLNLTNCIAECGSEIASAECGRSLFVRTASLFIWLALTTVIHSHARPAEHLSLAGPGTQQNLS
jgi:hypothetical protein